MFRQLRRMVKPILLCCALIPLLAMESPTSRPVNLLTIKLHDLEGNEIAPFAYPETEKAAVVVFIATDCPISNSYAPIYIELWKKYHESGIGFFAIYSDPSTHAAAAKQHCADYKIPFTPLLDTDQELMDMLGAKVTPEVFVVSPVEKVLYHGRIDDRYVSIGKPKFSATTHELNDALSAIVEGKEITTDFSPAVGCSIAKINSTEKK